jgi:hypothetical protein
VLVAAESLGGRGEGGALADVCAPSVEGEPTAVAEADEAKTSDAKASDEGDEGESGVSGSILRRRVYLIVLDELRSKG